MYKGFKFHPLSHNCHFGIDHDFLTTHSRSSSGDRLDLLSHTIWFQISLYNFAPNKPNTFEEIFFVKPQTLEKRMSNIFAIQPFRSFDCC